MNLYLLKQNSNQEAGTYDECVVCAENEEEAKKIHPNNIHFWDGCKWNDPKIVDDWRYPGEEWVEPIHVSVTYIGIAAESLKKGVITASFRM